MKWNDLSMADRAKYIKAGVDSGLTDLDSIHKAYHKYVPGGYLDWKEAIYKQRSKPGEEFDIYDENPAYDYEGFYMEDPERAWRMLKGDPEVHFTDKYKLPNHPTFSDESIYSTPQTHGGHWYEIDGKFIYYPSKYTDTPERNQRRREYMMNTGEGYSVGNKVYFPNDERGINLPELEVIGTRKNKYGGKSTPTQQMTRARVNYYDPITGKNYGSTLPEGKVRVNSFSDLTTEAQDEYMRNHPTTLDEVVIYPEKGQGAKSTSMGSYYDDISTMTDANIAHTARVKRADAIVKETAAFEKPLNFLSPGQWFGAGIDYLQGEAPFWSGIYNGNSGWVPDRFAEEHPGAAILLNMLGDAVVGKISSTGIKIARHNFNTRSLRRTMLKKLHDNPDASFMTEDEIRRLVARKYPYTHERINPFTSNSTYGRKFRYHTYKLLHDVELPTMYRKLKGVPDLSLDLVDLSPKNKRFAYNWGRGADANITNTTYDIPVRSHSLGEWRTADTYAAPYSSVLDYDFISTRPSDTFGIKGKLQVPKKDLSFISGDPDMIDLHRRNGIASYSSKALEKAFNELDNQSTIRLSKAPEYNYEAAMQRTAIDKFSRPTLDEYKFMDYVFRPVFRSNVVPTSIFKSSNPTLIPEFRFIQEAFGNASKRPILLNSDNWGSAIYDPSTPTEANLRKLLGIDLKKNAYKRHK